MSPSPSSCPSLDSPEPNFTRGIINPNYPGFQHLAHTLSEHFTDHHFEHSSDSDVSEEFELELSSNDYGRIDDDEDDDNNNNNNQVDETDNGNNGNEEADSVVEHEEQLDFQLQHQEKDNDVDDDFDKNGDNNSAEMLDESNINLLEKSEQKIFCDKKSLCLTGGDGDCNDGGGDCGDCDSKITNQSQHSPTENDENSLRVMSTINCQTAITTMDQSRQMDDPEILRDLQLTTTTTTTDENPNEYACDLDTYLKQYETSIDVNSDLTSAKDEPSIGDLHYDTTPDVLPDFLDISKLNEPDLLKNIKVVEDERIVEVKAAQTMKSPMLNDFSLRSTTPIDIVGDFGREIEREIGLIVSGYKMAEDDANKVKKEEESLVEVIEEMVKVIEPDEKIGDDEGVAAVAVSSLVKVSLLT